MEYAVTVVYLLTLIGLTVFSYGFNDPNLVLSSNKTVQHLQSPLIMLVYQHRPVTAGIFSGILLLMFLCYGYFLRHQPKIWTIVAIGALLLFSYPAFSYDLFNYMTTAKVAFHYHENPYIVMPVEIPNEPYLAFTRAANKVALYGPVWLLLTAIPNALGAGHIWQTMIAFKFLNAVVYLGFCSFIWRYTKQWKNVIFFALNPLVLLEVLVDGHNDIYMIMLALLGIYFWKRKGVRYAILGWVALFLSWWVKGATVVLAPLFFFRKRSAEHLLVLIYWLLMAVFVVAAPLREELYPWYAVWMIGTAAFLPLTTHRFISGLTIIGSFALELRPIPYMLMGYYEGPGPMARFLLTVVPIVLYLIYVSFKKQRQFRL